MIHKKVFSNQYDEIFLDFTQAELNFSSNIIKNKLLLQSPITDNFSALDSPLFAS